MSFNHNRRAITDVSVSIVNWNTKDELRKCLHTVFAQTGVSYDVTVVDNASSDGSAEMVEAEFPQIRLIRNPDNYGFGRAHNQAITATEGRYFLMVNPDARLHGIDFLQKMVAFADSHPEVGLIGPKVVNLNGTIQASARSFPTIAAAVFQHSFLGKLFPKNRYVREYTLSDWNHDEVREVDWLSGSTLMARREFIQQVGPLDESFFMYCEDVDWGYRAKAAGWKSVYYPGATVSHRIGASSDKAQVRMLAQHHASMYKLYKKHQAKNASILERAFVALGIICRAGYFICLNRMKRMLAATGRKY